MKHISTNEVQPITQEDPSTVVERTDKIELTSGNDGNIDTLYNDLYIGEIFKSGYAYIEPFKSDRVPFNESISFNAYSDIISFHTIGGSDNVYESTYNSESSVYIPSLEDSQYFWQGSAGESDQYTLCYETNDEINEPAIGITFMNHEISNIDFRYMGEDRVHSGDEYNNAVVEIEKSNKQRNELDGTLSERTMEHSIVGAKQICLIKLEDSNFTILLSKYLYLGFESTADVYVIDFLDEVGNVIKTLEKSNGVAY